MAKPFHRQLKEVRRQLRSDLLALEHEDPALMEERVRTLVAAAKGSTVPRGRVSGG